MAVTSTQGSDPASSSQAVNSLRQLAMDSTYSGDWSETRSHMRLALLAAVTMYQSRGPPRTRQSAPSPSEGPTGLTSTEVSSSSIGDAPSSQRPLEVKTSYSPTSPTTTTTQIQADDQPSSDGGNRSSSPPSIGPDPPSAAEAVEDLPSTPGGLVIPPFPPLDPNRQKRRGSGSSEGSNRVSHILINRPNGLGHPAPPIRIATGNVFEDEYDEDVIIGGKKLAGWMDEEEGRKEAERLCAVLDELDEPPFTVQRLAELLCGPTTNHSSLGKFFRAVEKMLLVQTPWQPQTYVPVPETFLTSGSKANYDPTLPPLMSTPKFSPIPWLQPDTAHANGSSSDMAHVGETSVSPLLLAQQGGEDSAEEMRLEDAEVDAGPSARSPTPEPEEPTTQAQDVDMSSSTADAQASAAHTDDPGNQPYLGRVDELDTGPIQAGPLPTKGSRAGREDEQMAPGAGEGGAMTPHGMSEKPVPISSTTVISEEERRIAGLRQTTQGQPEAAAVEGALGDSTSA